LETADKLRMRHEQVIKSSIVAPRVKETGTGACMSSEKTKHICQPALVAKAQSTWSALGSQPKGFHHQSGH